MALIVLTIYLVFIVLRYGWLPSVSDSYYHISHRVTFFLVMGFVAFLTLSAQEWHYLYFPLAAFGLMLVGVAPNFKTEGLAKILHFTGAGMIVLFGYLGITLEWNAWMYSLIFLVISGLAYWLVPKCKIYWFEIIAFSGLIGFLNSVV